MHFRRVVGNCVELGFELDPVAGAVNRETTEDGLGVDEEVVVGSLHPNQPGVSQVLVDVGSVEVVVTVGTGAGLLGVLNDEEDDEVVVISLHPNQPGVSQVVEVELELVLVEVEAPEVVVSSRQPHHPGVLHVSVLVLVAVLVVLLLVVVSVPLLSKNFHAKQSTHSSSSVHVGTSSYFSKTSLMTLRMLCVPTLTLHPRSVTVSYVHFFPVWQALSKA